MTSYQNCRQNQKAKINIRRILRLLQLLNLILKEKARWNEESESDMARGKCFWNSSYNNTTLFLCFFNLAIVALFVFHSLYASLSIHSTNVSHKGMLTNTNTNLLIRVFFFLQDKLTISTLISFLVFLVVVSYSPDQICKMEESVQIREASIPVELVKSVRTKIKN